MMWVVVTGKVYTVSTRVESRRRVDPYEKGDWKRTNRRGTESLYSNRQWRSLFVSFVVQMVSVGK